VLPQSSPFHLGERGCERRHLAHHPYRIVEGTMPLCQHRLLTQSARLLKKDSRRIRRLEKDKKRFTSTPLYHGTRRLELICYIQCNLPNTFVAYHMPNFQGVFFWLHKALGHGTSLPINNDFHIRFPALLCIAKSRVTSVPSFFIRDRSPPGCRPLLM
jgi:hypothetical protein